MTGGDAGAESLLRHIVGYKSSGVISSLDEAVIVLCVSSLLFEAHAGVAQAVSFRSGWELVPSEGSLGHTVYNEK